MREVEKKAGLGVPGVSDVCTSHPRKFQRPIPDVLKQRPKIKAKPRPTKPPQPPPTPPPTHSGAKRKNSRSAGAGSKQKAARLVAASSAPSHSGDSGVSGVASTNHISLKKPLGGETFKIYSGGKNQASNRDFQSLS